MIQSCQHGNECPYVRQGNCRYYHSKCQNGSNCRFLQTRSCNYYHDQNHFRLTARNIEIFCGAGNACNRRITYERIRSNMHSPIFYCSDRKKNINVASTKELNVFIVMKLLSGRI